LIPTRNKVGSWGRWKMKHGGMGDAMLALLVAAAFGGASVVIR